MASLEQLMQHYLNQHDPGLPVEIRRVLLKEFLQSYALDFIYNHSEYRRLNFYGGTCLHILYGLNRLSEDLDLDGSAGVELTRFAEDITAYFSSALSYPQVNCSTQISHSGIHRITLKFPILYSLGLTKMVTEPLHLKVEISTHPQTAVIRKTPVFTNGRSFVATHFSLETMMAGKMIACLQRNFQKGKDGVVFKGRDFYDLLWFMQQKVQPSQEKLAHDGIESYTVRSAMLELRNKISQIQPYDLELDLLPLFEQRNFILVWIESFQENFERFARFYLDEE
jgi:predicted nucleotidyltransferase component of viral defense system